MTDWIIDKCETAQTDLFSSHLQRKTHKLSWYQEVIKSIPCLALQQIPFADDIYST